MQFLLHLLAKVNRGAFPFCSCWTCFPLYILPKVNHTDGLLGPLYLLLLSPSHFVRLSLGGRVDKIDRGSIGNGLIFEYGRWLFFFCIDAMIVGSLGRFLINGGLLFMFGFEVLVKRLLVWKRFIISLCLIEPNSMHLY